MRPASYTEGVGPTLQPGLCALTIDIVHITALHDTELQKPRASAIRRTRRGARIHAEHRETVRDILVRLNASTAPEDMDLPGFGLHRLKGDYAGFWSVTVRANWRVIFRFQDGHAVDVDYLDYH